MPRYFHRYLAVATWALFECASLSAKDKPVNERPIYQLFGDVRIVKSVTTPDDRKDLIAFDKEGRVLYSWFHNESIRAYRWKKNKLIVEEVDSQNKRELDYSLQMVPADNGFIYLNLDKESGSLTGRSTRYVFDSQGRIQSLSKSGTPLPLKTEYKYSETGDTFTCDRTFYNVSDRGYEPGQEKVSYKILSTDLLGNWTSAQVYSYSNKKTTTITRTIQYYSSALPNPVSINEFRNGEVRPNELADNMFSVVVYKQVADVFSEPQKKSTTVGLVTSGECFSVISEKNGFYQIITDSGKPFAKRDFERCWIRRADVRQFTDSDYRNEVYYCKRAISTPVTVKQAVRKGKLTGADMRELNPGQVVEVISVDESGSYAQISIWDRPEKGTGSKGSYHKIGYVALSNLKQFDPKDVQNAGGAHATDLESKGRDYSEQERQLIEQRAKNDEERLLYYREHQPKGFLEWRDYLVLQFKSRLGLTHSSFQPYYNLSVILGVILIALFFLSLLCVNSKTTMIIWRVIATFAIMVAGTVWGLFILTKPSPQFDFCDSLVVGFWNAIEGFAIVTLFVGSYAELLRIWDKAYLINRSGNYRNIALPGCVITILLCFALQYVSVHAALHYGIYVILGICAVQIALSVSQSIAHGDAFIVGLWHGIFCSLTTLALALVLPYYIPKAILFALLVFAAIGFVKAPGRPEEDESDYITDSKGYKYRDTGDGIWESIDGGDKKRLNGDKLEDIEY